MSISSIPTNAASIHSLRIADAIIRLVNGGRGAGAGPARVNVTDSQNSVAVAQPVAAGAVPGPAPAAPAVPGALDTRA